MNLVKGVAHHDYGPRATTIPGDPSPSIHQPLERLQEHPDWTPDSEAAREVAHLARASGDTQAT